MDRFAEKYSSLSPYQYGELNPIINIDINGDSTWTTTREIRNGNNITIYHTTHIEGKVLKLHNGTGSASGLASNLNRRLNSQKQSLSIENKLGGTTTHIYGINANFSAASSMEDVKGSDHLVVTVDKVLGDADPKLGGGVAGGLADVGGKVAYVGKNGRGGIMQTAFHEVGHNLGLRHPDKNDSSNPMSYTGSGANFSRAQLVDIFGYARSGFSNGLKGGSPTYRSQNFQMLRNPSVRSVSTNEVPYLQMWRRIPRPILNN